MAKIRELGFELDPHPLNSPDPIPTDYFLFSDLKNMLAGKKCSSNEEVFAEKLGTMLNKRTYIAKKIIFTIDL